MNFDSIIMLVRSFWNNRKIKKTLTHKKKPDHNFKYYRLKPSWLEKKLINNFHPYQISQLCGTAGIINRCLRNNFKTSHRKRNLSYRLRNQYLYIKFHVVKLVKIMVYNLSALTVANCIKNIFTAFTLLDYK